NANDGGISSKPLAPPIQRDSHSHRFVAFSDEINKIFASVWLDSERVLVGSKCNALKVVDAVKGVQLADIAPICGYKDDAGRWVHGVVE
ncbi:UNVERIFIED_CONTAM: hypothetical protein HDU68_001298, partial [Siphonaria sp. JEL0065]